MACGISRPTIGFWLPTRLGGSSSRRATFLVKKGDVSDGVYLLLSGIARVHIPVQFRGRKIEAGEICGEMSFLEDEPASTTVVADSDVSAYHLNRLALKGLFELFPHLASRFYRSLAANLSRRLRELIGPVPESPTATARKRS